MSNNTTHVFHHVSFNTFNSDSVVKEHDLALDRVNLSLLIFIAALLPVTLVANGFVMAAIWRNPSHRTPSYILLAGLAFTDFWTGLISQPLWLANKLPQYLASNQLKSLDKSKWPKLFFITRSIGDGCAKYFYQITVLLITLMSIERWLHMTRGSVLTVRRVSYIVVMLSLLMLPLLVFPTKPGSNFINYLTCAMLFYCYFSSLLQSVSNNSSASTANSGQRDVSKPCSTSDQLCQVQEICLADSYYSRCFLYNILASNYSYKFTMGSSAEPQLEGVNSSCVYFAWVFGVLAKPPYFLVENEGYSK